MKTKPFSLEAAKRGEKIVTRDGHEVKFLAHVPEAEEPNLVCKLVDGSLCFFNSDGRLMSGTRSMSDLFLVVQSRSINGYEYPEPERVTPKFGSRYWFLSPVEEDLVYTATWLGEECDTRYLRRGLVHLTREAAEAHARAIILAGGGEV